jgi:hypothetical protein
MIKRYKSKGLQAARTLRQGAGPAGWPSPAVWLRGAVALALVGAVFFLIGCDDDEGCISCVDRTPPPPSGLFSVTGDRMVTLFWYRVWDEDIVEYVLYQGPEYEGPYTEIGNLGFEDNYDEATGLHYYDILDLPNGIQSFYAVTCVNAAGYESELSYEYVPDTPRPEGYDLELTDYNANPGQSGFDFSLLESGHIDPTPPTTADIFVVFENGYPYVQVARPAVVSLQDYGTFFDGEFVRLDWVDWAPVAGYSETGRAELIFGHAYIVRIEEGPGDIHFAKFAVTSIRSASVVVDWAYQVANNSRELKALELPKPPVGRAELIRF